MSLHKQNVEEFCDAIREWARKCDEMRVLAEDTTGETKEAYAKVYNDYLWRLRLKVGQMWYYLCGSEDMNPFTQQPPLRLPVPPRSRSPTLRDVSDIASAGR